MSQHTPAQTAAPVTNVYVTAPRAVKRTHHVFHAVMTLITGGLWGIVWLVQVLRHRGV